MLVQMRLLGVMYIVWGRSSQGLDAADLPGPWRVGGSLEASVHVHPLHQVTLSGPTLPALLFSANCISFFSVTALNSKINCVQMKLDT